jgi:hypothetical protein
VARTAWVLQEVAAARGGAASAVGALREDPVAWAYVLRDAIALAAPDVVVSHWDPALEADALVAGQAAGDDWVDRVLDAAPLAETAPASAAVELVRTLAGLPGFAGRVAVTVTCPTAVALAAGDALTSSGYDPDDDLEELTDLLADALSPLVSAYAAAGASTVLLTGAGVDVGTGPLERAAQHARVALLQAGGAGAPGLEAAAWSVDDDAFAAALASAASAAGPDGLLLSAGPVPPDADPARLRAARP